ELRDEGIHGACGAGRLGRVADYGEVRGCRGSGNIGKARGIDCKSQRNIVIGSTEVSEILQAVIAVCGVYDGKEPVHQPDHMIAVSPISGTDLVLVGGANYVKETIRPHLHRAELIRARGAEVGGIY